MKQGRRIPNPADKELRGTKRADRHSDIVVLAQPPRNEPVMPSYVATNAAAKAVWTEELRRAVQCGATEADSSLFARYCMEEGRYRTARLNGDEFQISALTELRRMAELLGIAGQRSRLVRSSGASKDDKTSAFGKPKPA